MGWEMIDSQLTSTERSLLLLLRLGYPDDQIRQALQACTWNDDIEFVSMDSFELERLIGDVSIYINPMNGGRVQGQLQDLGASLEYAGQTGDRRPETL
jgi:hypothetical protein